LDTIIVGWKKVLEISYYSSS